MRGRKKLQLAKLAIAGTSVILTSLTLLPVQAASLSRIDGSDPYSTGCAHTGKIVQSVRIKDPSGAPLADLSLHYSSGCKTAWAEITVLYNQCSEEGCLDSAKIVRNSDGANYSCNDFSHCYTSQLNDNGVTSYAEGDADYGIADVDERTRSY